MIETFRRHVLAHLLFEYVEPYTGLLLPYEPALATSYSRQIYSRQIYSRTVLETSLTPCCLSLTPLLWRNTLCRRLRRFRTLCNLLNSLL
jgi:hypothetical protein